MSKASRDKGSRGERLFANEFFDLTGIKLRRNLTQYQAKGNCDLVADPDQPEAAIELVSGLSFEIKNYATVTHGTIAKFWEQAVEQAAVEEKTPVLAVKASRQPWRVFIPNNEIFPTESFTGTISMGIELFSALVVNQKI